jgi:hypothetical protein
MKDYHDEKNEGLKLTENDHSGTYYTTDSEFRMKKMRQYMMRMLEVGYVLEEKQEGKEVYVNANDERMVFEKQGKDIYYAKTGSDGGTELISEDEHYAITEYLDKVEI